MSKRPLKSATAGVDNERKIELIRSQSYFVSILSPRTMDGYLVVNLICKLGNY